MNVSSKLFTFASALTAVFAVAIVIGTLAGPIGAGPPAPGGQGDVPAHGGHDSGSSTGEQPAAAGLAATQDGFQLRLANHRFRAGVASELRFTIIRPDGQRLTEYEVNHEKALHLIVASRDLATFRHLHPRLLADGTWTVGLDLRRAGAYKVFTDFAPPRRAAMTLGTDLLVEGDFAPDPLPAPSTTSIVDGYVVTLRGTLTPGAVSRVTLSISRNGHPVTQLRPYLGAYGHLVALRAFTLASPAPTAAQRSPSAEPDDSAGHGH